MKIDRSNNKAVFDIQFEKINNDEVIRNKTSKKFEIDLNKPIDVDIFDSLIGKNNVL